MGRKVAESMLEKKRDRGLRVCKFLSNLLIIKRYREPVAGGESYPSQTRTLPIRHNARFAPQPSRPMAVYIS